ncbi:hypothetical protein SBV1_1960002 [Verrucomicrobia bacterium]|nr:hypothetical protein SBV1_1960002 [Verrucomicrobiota bacterium]
MMGVRTGAHVVSGPESSGTPAGRGANSFLSLPEVFAALRPPATICQPSGLGAYGDLAIVNFFTASTRLGSFSTSPQTLKCQLDLRTKT